MPSFSGSRHNKPRALQRKLKILYKPLAHWHPFTLQLLNWAVTVASVLFCLLMLPTRFVGMELLGIGPNWLLIWVVSWSVKRSFWEGILAGIVLGLLQDAMTSPHPTHVITLGCVGGLTSLLQKPRFIQEDFISIALIVFVMAVVAGSIFGLQLTWMNNADGGQSLRKVEYIWSYYQRVSLASAILSSLWAPIVYCPLNLWWQKIKLLEQG